MITAQDRLNQILPSWYDLLSQWSLDGSLVAAATDALLLDSSNAKQEAKGQLQSYVSQWSAGNYKNLPQIVLLSAADIGGARGAYADSTDIIYLNQDWLVGASAEDIQGVLTEELGHFLDDLLNKEDTQGDEGSLLSKRLFGLSLTNEQLQALRLENDQISILTESISITAQAASVEKPPAIRGNSLYKFFKPITWSDAEAKSIDLGGHLVTINNESENSFLQGIATVGFFIGYNLKQGGWSWIGDQSSSFTKWRTQPEGGWPEPNNWRGIEDVAMMIIGGDFTGYWNDVPDDGRSVYGEFGGEGLAEIPLSLSFSRTGIIKEGGSFFTTSINLSAGTQTTGNLAEGAQVWWMISGVTQEDLASGALTGTGTITNGKLDIQHSLVGDSDTGESFDVSVYSDSFLAQKIGSTSFNAIEEAAPLIRGNSLYKIAYGSTWAIAEGNAGALGGNLVTINDALENAYLLTGQNRAINNLGGDGFYWLGIQDSDDDGFYTWSSGQQSGYRSWAINEPSGIDIYGPENYGFTINFLDGDPSESQNGYWFDTTLDGNGRIAKGIAEIPLNLSITRTGTPKEGAGLFTTSINLSAGSQTSGNLAEGAQVWWKITGISQADLATGSLTGSGTITNGKLDVQHSLVVDADTGENMEVSVYSDAWMTQQIGSTNLAGIQEAPSIRINNISIVEGITANTLATLTITLSSTSTQTISAGYTTVDGIAKAGTDYTASSGTLTIAAGQTSGTISIPILNNDVNEANESFTVQLSNPVNATLVATSATVTITDTLTSAVTAALPAGVENLTLTGTAAVNGTGNAGPNILTGNSAANTLAGLAGNDTYRFVANTQLGSDTVTEAASAGTDSINLASTTTAVRLNLGITTVQTVNANLKLAITNTNTIENAVGGNSDDVLTGNTLANALAGGTGADRLSGLVGNDILDGGLGNDLLTGGVGLDRFRFASGAAFATTIGNDYLTDFTSGEDKIELSKKTFAAITTAAGSPLTSSTTVDDDSLVDASASVIVYSSSSGGLFYNMNAAATGDATKVFEFASLGNVPAAMFASDFTVIA